MKTELIASYFHGANRPQRSHYTKLRADRCFTIPPPAFDSLQNFQFWTREESATRTLLLQSRATPPRAVALRLSIPYKTFSFGPERNRPPDLLIANETFYH